MAFFQITITSKPIREDGYGPLFAEDFLLQRHTFLFFFRNETLFNIMEKQSVQNKVDDQHRNYHEPMR